MISGSVKAVLAVVCFCGVRSSEEIRSADITNWNAEVPRDNFVLGQAGVSVQSTLPALCGYKEQTGEKGGSCGQAYQGSKQASSFTLPCLGTSPEIQPGGVPQRAGRKVKTKILCLVGQMYIQWPHLCVRVSQMMIVMITT